MYGGCGSNISSTYLLIRVFPSSGPVGTYCRLSYSGAGGVDGHSHMRAGRKRRKLVRQHQPAAAPAAVDGREWLRVARNVSLLEPS